MEPLAWWNDRIVPMSQATVPLNDRGFLVGDGVFETMRTAGPRIFQFPAHAARMADGLRRADIPEPAWHPAVEALVAAGWDAFACDMTVRVQVSAGPMDDIPGADSEPRMTATVRPLQPPPASKYEGIHIGISPFKMFSDAPLAGVKTLSFITYIAARRDAVRRGLDDALLTNEHGRIVEGSTSNVLARLGDRVHAPGPSEGAVAGVTRDLLVAGLDRPPIPTLTMDQLMHADEVCLTNTSGGAIPVTRIDGRPVGDGRVGAWARDLHADYQAILEAA